MTKYFRHKIVFLAKKTFSDEMFSSLKVKKKKKTKKQNKSNQTFSDEIFCHQDF